MEQVVYHLQLSSAGSRQLRIHKDVLKEFKDCVNRVLRAITKWMVPSTYFGAITHLLGHSSGSVKKKVLSINYLFLYSQLNACKQFIFGSAIDFFPPTL